MPEKMEAELLKRLNVGYEKLPGYVKAQAGEVFLPLIGLLLVLLAEKNQRETRRAAALAHLDSVGNGLREKTALGIYLTGGGEHGKY